MIAIAVAGVSFSTVRARQQPPDTGRYKSQACDDVACAQVTGIAGRLCGGGNVEFACRSHIAWAPAQKVEIGDWILDDKQVCPGGSVTIVKCREVFVATTWSSETGCGACNVLIEESGGAAVKYDGL